MITPQGADITNLFRSPDPAEAYRQGVIVAFNPATGANQVNVGGAVLVDLPLLNIGDTVNLAPGNAVILLKYQGSWAILGRIIRPGAAALSASALDFVTDTQQATGYSIDTFGGGDRTKVSSVITVPAWADTAAVMAWANVVGKQPTTPVPAGSVMTTRILIGGDTDANNPQGWVEADNHVADAHPTLSRVLTVTPGATITTEVEVWASGAWGVSTSNYTRLQVMALFRKAAP